MSKIFDIEFSTYSTDAIPTALQGTVYWYDTGTTLNGESVRYDMSGTYAYWYSLENESIITTVADVGNESVENFFGDVILEGFGSFSGRLNLSTNTIADAWYRAETTAFESLRSFLGCTEGKDCVRGFLPVMGDGDDYKSKNIWQMSSGSSDEFAIERVKGDNASWCSLRADARIESIWDSREKAMKFAGAVEAWLVSTDNLTETSNIEWCTLASIPSEPEIYRTQGENRKRYWIQNIDLELVYKTASVFS